MLDIRLRTAFDVATTAAILTTCAVVLYSYRPDGRDPARVGVPVPTLPLSIEGAATKGSVTAPVVVIEYSDYMCPACAKAESDALPQLNRRYVDSGRVQLAVRHFPLESIHHGATKAAVAAVCAANEGKFWEMHDALFADQKKLDQPSLVARAESLSLDVRTFGKCLSGQAADQVTRDVQSATELNLRGTPAFLVGRRQAGGLIKVVSVISGAVPFSTFEREIEAALAGEAQARLKWPALLGGSGIIATASVLITRRVKRKTGGAAC